MPQIVATRKTWYQIRLQNDFVMKLHILMPSKRLRFNFAVHRFYVLGSLFVLIFGTTSGSKLWQNSWIIKQTDLLVWKFWRIYLVYPGYWNRSVVQHLKLLLLLCHFLLLHSSSVYLVPPRPEQGALIGWIRVWIKVLKHR